MTLVERMARAMAEDAKDYTFERTGQLSQHFRSQAIAALRAMREPTDHMIAQGVSAAEHYASTDEIYSRMVDAALSEAERHVNEEG